MPFYFLVAQRTEASGTLTSKNVVAIHSGKDGELPTKIIDVPTDEPGPVGHGLKWQIGVKQSGAILELKRLAIPDGPDVDGGHLGNIQIDLGIQSEGTIAGSAVVSGGFIGGVEALFIIVKDRERVLFTTEDNFACTTIYFSVAVGTAKIAEQ